MTFFFCVCVLFLCVRFERCQHAWFSLCVSERAHVALLLHNWRARGKKKRCISAGNHSETPKQIRRDRRGTARDLADADTPLAIASRSPRQLAWIRIRMIKQAPVFSPLPKNRKGISSPTSCVSPSSHSCCRGELPAILSTTLPTDSPATGAASPAGSSPSLCCCC